MSVMGIDCSSKAVHTVTLTDDGEIESYTGIYGGNKFDTFTRWKNIVVEFQNFMKQNMLKSEINLVVIEKPIMIQNALATIAISKVVAAVETLLTLYKFPIVEVDNNTWKKQVIGKGNSNKEKIMEWATNKWPEVEFKEQDFADAACIAQWGVLNASKNR